MRERPRLEGSLPDPTVGVRYHNEDWGLTFGDSDFSFVEIGAEQEIPFPGKRAMAEIGPLVGETPLGQSIGDAP